MAEVPDINKLYIRTLQDLEEAVEAFGILPLFRNAIPGFSIEEHVAKEAWFESEEGVWEWKGPVIRDTGCAYGKFLGNKAVFISREFFPDFVTDMISMRATKTSSLPIKIRCFSICWIRKRRSSPKI